MRVTLEVRGRTAEELRSRAREVIQTLIPASPDDYVIDEFDVKPGLVSNRGIEDWVAEVVALI